ncbi:hypothetical protein Plhal304r1_c042g0121551 [Plasmopara halstedii]
MYQLSVKPQHRQPAERCVRSLNYTSSTSGGDSPLHILNFPASIHTLINKDIQKKSDDQCLFGCP